MVFIFLSLKKYKIHVAHYVVLIYNKMYVQDEILHRNIVRTI